VNDEKLVVHSIKYPMDSDGYVLKDQIASGMNMNKVFIADCPARGHQVAIKHIDLSSNSLITHIEKIKKRSDRNECSIFRLCC